MGRRCPSWCHPSSGLRLSADTDPRGPYIAFRDNGGRGRPSLPRRDGASVGRSRIHSPGISHRPSTLAGSLTVLPRVLVPVIAFGWPHSTRCRTGPSTLLFSRTRRRTGPVAGLGGTIPPARVGPGGADAPLARGRAPRPETFPPSGAMPPPPPGRGARPPAKVESVRRRSARPTASAAGRRRARRAAGGGRRHLTARTRPGSSPPPARTGGRPRGAGAGSGGPSPARGPPRPPAPPA